jgi:diguanylate cyclase (GGDEF)-like protein/PAS domain S-box-containing protein
VTDNPRRTFLARAGRAPWLLIAIFLLLVAGFTAAFRGPRRLLPYVAGACLVLSCALLYLLWRLAVSSHERFQQSKWDQANKTMADFIQLLIDIMPNPAFFKDLEGRYVGTNAAFEKLLGRSKSEIIGKAINDVASPEIVEKHLEHDHVLLAEGGHQVYEAPLSAWDGEHHVIFIKTAYRRPDGTIAGILGILKDITQRLRSEQEIEQLRRFSESTAQTMTEGLVLTDAEGRFTFVNPAAARMIGYSPAEMIDRPVLSFVPKECHGIVRRADEKRSKGISDRYELPFLHRDGTRRVILVSGGPRIQGAQFGGTLAVLTDITERKAMEEEIRALSLHDELTGLHNRRGFMTLADHVLKTGSRMKKAVALIYLDVDDLKRINDSGGHKMGDRALVEIAFILKKSFRESDIMGRLGGDEFAILAQEATTQIAGTLIQRLGTRLEQFNSRSSAEAGFSLSASAGVCVRDPNGSESIEEMLTRADLLMYEQKRAKKSGEGGKPRGPSK